MALGAIGGVIAYRWLAVRAAVERADAAIEERFRALEEPQRARESTR